MATKYRQYAHLSRDWFRNQPATMSKDETNPSAPKDFSAPPKQGVRGVHELFKNNDSIGLISAEPSPEDFNPIIKGGHEVMKQHLSNMGLTFHETHGKYGVPERSFIVHNPSVHQLMDLGRKFGQESVIHSQGGKHRLIYTSGPKYGKFHAASPDMELFHDGAPHDYYTAIPGGGHFRLHFDWDRLHDMPQHVRSPDMPVAADNPHAFNEMRPTHPDATLKSEKQHNLLGTSPEVIMSDNFVSVDDIRKSLAKSIKTKIDAYAAELVDLRKKELSKNLDPAAQAGQDPLAPEGAGDPSAFNVQPAATQDLCPLCHKEDKPGVCTCLGAGVPSAGPAVVAKSDTGWTGTATGLAMGEDKKSKPAKDVKVNVDTPGVHVGNNWYPKGSAEYDKHKKAPTKPVKKAELCKVADCEKNCGLEHANGGKEVVRKSIEQHDACKCATPKPSKLAGGPCQNCRKPTLAPGEKHKGASDSKKSEEYIDLANESVPGKRLKEQHKHKGVTPDDKESKVIDTSEGSGGKVTQKAEVSMAKPPSGKIPGGKTPAPAASNTSKPGLVKTAMPGNKMPKDMKALASAHASQAGAAPAAPAPAVKLPGQADQAARQATFAAFTPKPTAPAAFKAPPKAAPLGSKVQAGSGTPAGAIPGAKPAAPKPVMNAARPQAPGLMDKVKGMFGKSEFIDKCPLCRGSEHIGACKK